ncbi:MAG TPA: serine protease [Actinomycetota bacterium]|nr:serine protease [Actinomycetota bacterium]
MALTRQREVVTPLVPPDVEESAISQILPRTLAGLALWLVLIATGMAASGVVLFAYYQHRLSEIQQAMATFAVNADKQFKENTKQFEKLVADSKGEIEAASKGIGAQTQEVTELLEKIGPSIAYISGVDPAGAPAIGSGFVVTSNQNESWVLTNFHIVAGAAANKQEVRVRIGSADRAGTIWTWDERRDLALVILKVGGLPEIEWAKAETAIGSQVWAVGTAPGKHQAAASKGFLLDTASDGLLLDAGVPVSSSGGPLLTKDGKVLGVLSNVYAPDGFPSSEGWAVPIRLACQKVLRCPG